MGRVKSSDQHGSKTIERQSISPKLLRVCLEGILGELDQEKSGLRVSGEYLSHLRFADSNVLLSESGEHMQESGHCWLYLFVLLLFLMLRKWRTVDWLLYLKQEFSHQCAMFYLHPIAQSHLVSARSSFGRNTREKEVPLYCTCTAL